MQNALPVLDTENFIPSRSGVVCFSDRYFPGLGDVCPKLGQVRVMFFQAETQHCLTSNWVRREAKQSIPNCQVHSNNSLATTKSPNLVVE